MNIKQWLRQHTLFMNQVSYLAQMSHFLFGYGLMLTVAYFKLTVFWMSLIFGLTVVCAAIKEFYFDANFEVPHQTNKDNWIDFSFYCLGLVVGLGVSCLKLLF